MDNSGAPKGRASGIRLGDGEVAYLDLALAIAASAFMVRLVHFSHTGHARGGPMATALALSMTIPVAFRRNWPVRAAMVVAAAAWINGALYPGIVRCGPGLPSAFLIAFACGMRLESRRARQGLGFCLAAVVGQCILDPVLGPPIIVMMIPITTVAWGCGRLVRSRVALAATLRIRNAELREQREENARLAVVADREQVAHDLDSFLHEQIAEIAQQADQGSRAISTDPAAAKRALEGIEDSGRATLARMRSVVGSLKQASNEPQPVLAQLGALVARATKADGRLEVLGDPRQLPAGIELSGYRIVEHLLLALDSDPKARVEVTVSFESDALALRISGTARKVDPSSALAAVKERVALHGGSMQTKLAKGRCDVFARLPLAAH